MLVLLDLLGTADAKLYSFFSETSHWHNALVQTEQQLKRSRAWSGSTRQSIFQSRQQNGGIEDDHIPFLRRGVDILHLIPVPFPNVWHKNSDDRSALHFPTISNLNKVFRLFVARYLHLPASSTKWPTNTIHWDSDMQKYSSYQVKQIFWLVDIFHTSFIFCKNNLSTLMVL